MPKARPTLAKLTRPRLHAPVKRTRLFKLLDEGKSYPIVWVNGPPGAGKTTLIASYLEARKANSFWYQVDEGDRDPATLFHYLAMLAAQSKSRKRTSLPSFTADYLPDLAGFTRRYFRELFARLGANAVLVLDNCQDAESETFQLILREACQQIPADARLVALSRSTPPAKLSRETTNMRLQNLAWPQLRLSDSEALAIAQASNAANPEGAIAFNHQCDGWVGGLVLLLAHSERGSRSEDTRAFESREALFDYFAEEVFARAGPATQQLLLRTSLFPYTTVSMAVSITTDELSGHILSALYNKQYFVDRKVEGELTYQYHDLFREFLLRRLSAQEPAPQLAALRRHAAQILEATGRLTEAVELFKQVQDWPNLTRLIHEHGNLLLAQGRWQTLLGWFEALPEHLVESDPWLLFWRANAQVPADGAGAYLALNRAYDEFVSRNDRVGEFYALSKASYLTYTLGLPFHVFDEWFPRLERQLAQFGASLTPEVGVQARSAYLTMLQIRIGKGGQIGEAQDWLAAQFFANRLEQAVAIDVGDMLLHQAIWPVQSDLGQRVDAPLQALAQREDSPPESRYSVMKDLGYWRFFNAEYAQSLSFFDQAKGLATRFGLHAQTIYVQCYQAMAWCFLGDLQRAETIMKDVVSALGDDVFSNSAVNWALGVLDAAHGNYGAAFDRTATASAQARAAGFTLLELVTGLPTAVYAVELNRIEEAAAIVAHLRAVSRDTIWRFAHCLLAAIDVEINLRRDEKGAALASLRETLRLAHNTRMAAFLVSAKHWLPRHFSFALAENMEVSTVRQLIRRFDLAPDDCTDQRWPWPVTVRALGAFEIAIDGEPMTFSSKAPKKTLALLKVIIAFGGREVKVEEILDALWPDSESDAAHEALKITLLRLRKLLRSPDAIESQQGKLALNPSKVWVDALAFERNADHAPGTVAGNEYPAALKLYRGNFLAAEEEQPWSVLARERLRRKFVQRVAVFARHAEQAQNYDVAEQVYSRGLDADNLIEQFYQGLMRCHLAREQRPEGMAVFRRLRQILSVTLGVAPSPESQLLFQALQHQSARGVVSPA